MSKCTRGFLAALAGATALPHPAAFGAALEEVIVTARKRVESAVDSPVSVSAFTAADIDDAGIDKPGDFIGLTPNVTLVETQNAGTAFINIRGVSQARNSEASAAVLLDGVLMANPAQFNQQLFDVEQIEVLRGPQGALYGRNAIGGAVTIVTRQPTDEFEGRFLVGADNGPGYSVQGSASGPVGASETLRFRASGSWVDTDGYLDNPFLGREPDPYEDLSGRMKLLWDATDRLTADVRASFSRTEAGSLYFTIVPDADDTFVPIRTNNQGTNQRDLYNVSLKLDYEADYGTFTSITSWDEVEEVFAGDQFSFQPRAESFINGDGFGAFLRSLTGDDAIDLSQTQYLEVEAVSQEVRFTSPGEDRFRWIVGGYFIATDRYISTGNQVDRGLGVFDVERTPRPSVFVDPTDPSPQLGLLADAQDNFAWALFGEVAYDFTDRFEASLSLRYDEDTRENTSLTEPLYDPTGLGLTPGEVREETWDALQPRLTLRYEPSDTVTVYGGWSRGFRSGGFNQTGVGAAIVEPGIEDLFDEQIADTVEVGAKALLAEGRVSLAASVYRTDFEGAYFFFFDPNTSTQNLGSIDETRYQGLELEGSAVLADGVNVYFGLGWTDSEIEDAPDPADEGNQAPLVTELTLNLGAQVRRPLTSGGPLGEFVGVARVDYQRLGDTWWDPGNITVRSPVDLVDLRVGIESAAADWSLTLWAKNATDEVYNSEFSPGPAPGANFVFRAPPRRWGLEFRKDF